MKEAQMTVFGNEELNVEVRTVMLNDEPWFVAKDIATALGYKRTADAVSQHCKRGRLSTVPSAGGPQNMVIIPESDLYRLIFRSKLPAAEKFEKWVVEEVLPKIRKTGSYSIKRKPSYLLDDPIERAKAWIEEQEEFKRTKAQIADKQTATALATASNAVQKSRKLEIMLDESKDYATVKRVEMLTGEKFGWRPLKTKSENLGYEVKKVFDVNYGEVNSYHRNVWVEVYGIDLRDI